jgi:hypothetical protein
MIDAAPNVKWHACQDRDRAFATICGQIAAESGRKRQIAPVFAIDDSDKGVSAARVT